MHSFDTLKDVVIHFDPDEATGEGVRCRLEARSINNDPVDPRWTWTDLDAAEQAARQLLDAVFRVRQARR